MSLEKALRIHSQKSRTRAIIEEIGKIKFDRTLTAVSADPDYLEKLPEIVNIYQNVALWHGTGRHKYSDSGDVVDILDGIIKDKGLIPHRDEWDKKRGIIHTVSAAPSRMYARLYAEMYVPAATRINNELGSRELWGYYFFGTSSMRGILEYRSNIRAIRRGDDSSSFIPGFKRKTEQWTSKVTVQKHNIK